MKTLKGKGVSGGLTLGRIVHLVREKKREASAEKGTPEQELRRFETALASALSQLEAVHERARRALGESDAEIFAVHRMMLEDDDFLGAVKEEIKRGTGAQTAIESACERFGGMLAATDDPYLSARASDLRDVSGRLISCLSGTAAPVLTGENIILCADELAPSETVMLDTSRVLAFVTARGSAGSHTAILASGLGIPAIVGLGEELLSVAEGAVAIVDGDAGELILSPSPEALDLAREKAGKNEKRKERLSALRGKPSRTRDGREILLYANVGTAEGALEALSGDAEGIGLFRSELLYLGRSTYPSEQEQYRIYRRVLEEMGGRRTVIRTLDVGADKQADYLGLASEENPALGLRAIRFCLLHPEILRTQLRALYRASVCGTLAILFPMITSEWELREVLALCDAVKRELREEGARIAERVELGIMIETPAAAIISDRLAPLVDFFSVGTNDLVQYTLACDRGNRALDRFCDPHHEAVLRLIQLSAKNAHAEGKWIGICGELAADPTLTETFLRMGIDELSVSPPLVLSLRETVRSLDLSRK